MSRLIHGILFHIQSENTGILTILHTFRVRQRGNIAAPAAFLVPREVLPMVLPPSHLKGTGGYGLQASWGKGHCGSLYPHASWFRKFETDSDIWREPPKVSWYFHAFKFTLFINNLNCRICCRPQFLKKPQEFQGLEHKQELTPNFSFNLCFA